VITHTEFRKRLEQLREVIARGSAYWAVSKKLRYREEGKVSWSLEEQNKILGRFHGFFTPVALAVLDMAFLEFNKVFDADPRTVSLLNLLRAARQDTSLVSGRTSAEVDEVSRRFRQSKKVLTGLMRRRDQHLAHADANPAPVDPLLVGEFDALVEHVESAFNWLSGAHDGRVVGWEYPLRRVEEDTSQIVGILLEELSRRDAIAERTRS
jgi:hypothetical protein